MIQARTAVKSWPARVNLQSTSGVRSGTIASNHSPMHQYLERVVDLTDPSLNRIHNLSVEEARQRVLAGTPEEVREIDGSFALVARKGKKVRLARSLDRPLRYFLAKRHEGPALIVADRMD